MAASDVVASPFFFESGFVSSLCGERSTLKVYNSQGIQLYNSQGIQLSRYTTLKGKPSSIEPLRKSFKVLFPVVV